MQPLDTIGTRLSKSNKQYKMSLKTSGLPYMVYNTIQLPRTRIMHQNPQDRADTRHKSDHIHINYSDGALIATPPMPWLEGAIIHADLASPLVAPPTSWRHLPSPLVAPPTSWRDLPSLLVAPPTSFYCVAVPSHRYSAYCNALRYFFGYVVH